MEKTATKGPKVLFVIGFILLLLFGTGNSAEIVDHSLYGGLLNKNVREGHVDYAGFKSEEILLDQYLDRLSGVDPDLLEKDEQFAFYINAYNAWTIKLILSGYPGVDSIKDFGRLFQTPWEKKIARIDGEVVTLDHIEHDILRPRFKDPRVHFAINCAALSCPPLRSEPYLGHMLSSQLDDATKSFLNNPERNYLKGDKLHVSKIFRWFSEDFEDDVVGFFEKYAQGDLKAKLQSRGRDLKVRFLPYDWSLNGK